MKRRRIVDTFLAVAIAGAGLAGWLALRRDPSPRPGPEDRFLEEEISRRDHVRLIVSGRLMAEIAPCGCKRGHYGGIARVATAMKEARAGVPGVVSIDAGDSLVSPDSRRRAVNDAQTLKKSEAMAEFLGATQPEVVALGELDLLPGSAKAGELLNGRGFVPVLTNAVLPADLKTVPFAAFDRSGYRFVVCNLFAKSAFGDIAGATATDPLAALDEALRVAARADVLVVCCHRFDEALLRQLATRPGPPRLLVDVEGTGGAGGAVGRSLVVRPPPKGESLLTVDLYLKRDATGFYDLGAAPRRPPPAAARAAVAAANLFETGARLLDVSVKEDPAVQAIAGRYRGWAAQSGAIEARPDPGAPPYTGATACGTCHAAQLTNWASTLHAKAWESLEKDPGKGFEDPECASCHVSGFGLPGGPARLVDTYLFRGVQCESCHAPVSGHPGGAKFGAVTEAICRSCHTETRDPDFRFDADLPLATCTKPHDPAARRPPR